MSERIETYRVTVRGHVQGVGFRHAMLRQAHALKIRGWVMNQDDGTVLALVQGTPDLVDRMLQWLRFGPPGARVDDLDIREEWTERRFERFEQH